jgi:hypothetical protein
MKDRFLITAFFSILCSFSFAQEERISSKQFYPEDRRWMLSLSYGANFDLYKPNSSPYSGLSDTRKNDACLFAKYKIVHLFSDKFGWFADLQINCFWEKRSEYLEELQSEGLPGLIEGVFEGFGKVFSFPHPSVSAGMLYRIEHGRWKIHPEIGIGYGTHLWGREKERSKTDDNGVVNSVFYKQDGSSLFMTFGISASFFVSRRCFFTLHTNFQQPLQKSGAKLIRSKDEVEVENISYRSANIGKSINVDLGFGFTIGKKH